MCLLQKNLKPSYQGEHHLQQCHPVTWKIPCALLVSTCDHSCSWCGTLPRGVPPIWKFRISGRWRLREEGKEIHGAQSVCERARKRLNREGGRNVKHQQHSTASPCTACSIFTLSVLLLCNFSV